jgi:diguanylate cyclase
MCSANAPNGGCPIVCLFDVSRKLFRLRTVPFWPEHPEKLCEIITFLLQMGTVARGKILSQGLRTAKEQGGNRLKLLIWAAVFALFVGVTGLALPIDVTMRLIGDRVAPRAASGQIVLVGIDDKSLAQLGQWPWPRDHHAKMIRELNRLGATQVSFDIIFDKYSGTESDNALVKAIATSKASINLASEYRIDSVRNSHVSLPPAPQFLAGANEAGIDRYHDGFGYVWRLPFSDSLSGRKVLSMSNLLSLRNMDKLDAYPVDYAVDLKSIPYISASDLISGKVSKEQVDGKRVIIGAASLSIGDVDPVPVVGPVPGVYLHIAGAETLLRGTPIDLGWLAAVVVAAIACGIFLFSRNRLVARLVIGSTVIGMIAAGVLLERFLIFGSFATALVMLTVVIARHAWVKYQLRGSATNNLSGLPNLNALNATEFASDQILLVARINNYAQAVSTFADGLERSFVDELIKRLGVGGAERTIYHADDGIFAWILPNMSGVDLAGHLEGLSALFNSPVVVGQNQIDVSVSFGIDRSEERSSGKRFIAALAAATDAAGHRETWSSFDTSQVEKRQWNMSLVGRLNDAIDHGHVWVAYQPKLDLKTGQLVGAEALARWTDPQHGEVPPDEFILAAETQNRIEKLTEFVVNESLAAASRIQRRGVDFTVAVNLSPRVMEALGVVSIVCNALEKHKVTPESLTLELTETAGIEKSSRASATLMALRALGVRIAIDDYGTGYSTLDYMSKIPAQEIKIDKQFVTTMANSQPNRTIVMSTIQLAHDLGRTIVAEGVEDAETLDMLTRLGCDQAQGFFVGRPMMEAELMATLGCEAGRSANGRRRTKKTAAA